MSTAEPTTEELRQVADLATKQARAEQAKLLRRRLELPHVVPLWLAEQPVQWRWPLWSQFCRRPFDWQRD